MNALSLEPQHRKRPNSNFTPLKQSLPTFLEVTSYKPPSPAQKPRQQTQALGPRTKGTAALYPPTVPEKASPSAQKAWLQRDMAHAYSVQLAKRQNEKKNNSNNRVAHIQTMRCLKAGKEKDAYSTPQSTALRPGEPFPFHLLIYLPSLSRDAYTIPRPWESQPKSTLINPKYARA